MKYRYLEQTKTQRSFNRSDSGLLSKPFYHNLTITNNEVRACVSLTLDQEVLLGGKDGLLGLVVGELAGAEVGGGAALGEQHGGLGGGVSVESRSEEKNINTFEPLNYLSNLTWTDQGRQPRRRREQRRRGDQKRWGRGWL